MYDVTTYLQNALSQNSLPHTLLFVGSGGETRANALAMTLLQTELVRIETGNHPDFSLLRPEGQSGLHTIASLRLFIDRMYRAPFEAMRKVFVIDHAERMQSAAANALLKTLEEPPPDTYLILLAMDTRKMLPTILSRCTQLTLCDRQTPQSIDFSHLSEELVRLGRELEAMEDSLLQHRSFEEGLMSLMLWMRDAHARRAGVAEKYLFFAEAPSPDPLLSLEKLEAILQKARLAYQRNLKPSTILEWVLYQIT